MSQNKTFANINIDLDTLNDDLREPSNNPNLLKEITYQRVVPRFLNFLRSENLKATFFCIGQDVKTFPEVIKSIDNDGHEIANHTMNHPKQFALLSMVDKEQEIALAEKEIERITGKRPEGFRAPGYTIDEDVFTILRKRQYSYDASLNNSLFYFILKSIYKQLFIKNKNYLVLQKLKHYASPAVPYIPRADAFWKKEENDEKSSFIEIPIGKMKGIDLPFISAVLLCFHRFLPASLFYNLSRRPMINLQFHINEFTQESDIAGVEEDFILTKTYCSLPLEKRLTSFSSLLNWMKRDYTLITLNEMAASLKGKNVHADDAPQHFKF